MTMPDPITLADVRAHIERRLQKCRDMETRWPKGHSVHHAGFVIRRELTEVLAMLQQIEQRNETALKELDELVDKERERRR